MDNTNQQLNPEALSIVKALAYTENGGAPDISNLSAGQSGEEKSIFQFMPDTWKIYAKQVFGDPNTPLTPENESVVTYQKVNNWLNEGYSVKQIASMWNAGEQRPDAYLGNQGKNKQGVPYNTTKYANKVAQYAQQFGDNSSVDTSATKNTQMGGQVASSGMMPNQSTQTNQTQNQGLLPPQMKQVRQV